MKTLSQIEKQNKLKKLAAKVANSKATPFVCLFLLMLAVHTGFTMHMADDTIYITYLEQYGNLLNYWKACFREWSARHLSESVVVYIIHFPNFWRVLDSAMITLSAYCLYSLFQTQESKLKTAWICCGAVLLYPLSHLMSAGWITTTVIYLWSGACGLFALVGYKKAFLGQKLRLWEWILRTAALIFACNFEQLAVAILVIGLCLIGYSAVKKSKATSFLYVGFVLNIGCILYSMLCPGVKIRLENETAGWFPEFNQIPLWRKLEMGFSSTVRDFALKPNLVFLLFALMLLAAVLLHTKKHRPELLLRYRWFVL